MFLTSVFFFSPKRQDNPEWKRGVSHLKNVNTDNPHEDDLLALLLIGLCIVKHRLNRQASSVNSAIEEAP